jgi:hypothetical protein
LFLLLKELKYSWMIDGIDGAWVEQSDVGDI